MEKRRFISLLSYGNNASNELSSLKKYKGKSMNFVYAAICVVLLIVYIGLNRVSPYGNATFIYGMAASSIFLLKELYQLFSLMSPNRYGGMQKYDGDLLVFDEDAIKVYDYNDNDNEDEDEDEAKDEADMMSICDDASSRKLERKIDYCDIQEAYELYSTLIFISKAKEIYIINKADLKNNADDFKDFIAEKLNVKITYVDSVKTDRSRILPMICGFITLLIFVASLAITSTMFDVSKTYNVMGRYSIDLAIVFKHESMKGFDFYATSRAKDANVFVVGIDSEQLEKEFGDSFNIEEYAKSLVVERLGQRYEYMKKYEDGMVTITYLSDVDSEEAGNDVMCTDALIMGDDGTLWFTEFSCKTQSMAKYEKRFLKYLKSISVSGNGEKQPE